MKNVIQSLMTKAGESHDACQAQQFAQAALSIANANCVMPKGSANGLTEAQIKDYAQILKELIAVRDAQYRSDPERLDALLQAVTEALQATLEKLSAPSGSGQ